MSVRTLLPAAALLVLAACSSTDLAAPLPEASARLGKSAPAANIPVETVGPGVLANPYRVLDMGVDAQGRTYWVEEFGAGYDALGEPVGSIVLHVLLADTATVRVTIRQLRQRTGWTVVVPSDAVYDNRTIKVTWNSPTETVTVTSLSKPGRRVDDHGLVRKR